MKMKIDVEIKPIPSSSSYSLSGILLLVGDNEEGIPIGTEGIPLFSLPPIPHNGREEKKPREKKPSPEGFEEWYAIYPRKVARRDAEDAFRRLIQSKVPLDVLMAATQNYIRQTAGTEMQYIKHPASFLRNERWRDYTPASESTHRISAEEIASIKEKYREGEYDEALVRKIERKYGVEILP